MFFIYRHLSCGFVTFDKMDVAAKAIAEMNGATVTNINLRVSLARRQPIIDQGSESNWSTIGRSLIKIFFHSRGAGMPCFHACIDAYSNIPAASNSQKGSHRDSRDLVNYNESVF